MTSGAPPIPNLPERDPEGHKGTFGTVAVVGGCARGESMMLGGPCISAIAALRAGAGLAKLALPMPILAEGLTIAPSATGVALPTNPDGSIDLARSAAALDELFTVSDCLAVGPGLGVDDSAEAVTLRCVGQTQAPVVIDADAINALANIPELTREFRAHAVLTPHPGEYRGIASALGIDLDPTDAVQRPDAAAALAQKLGCIVVLKGAHTVVSDGQMVWTCEGSPNAALGTAGTGDALTGCIAGLIAQFHRAPILAGERTVTSEARGGLSLFDLARLGVLAHAMAGRAWADEHGTDGGLLAMELCDRIPEAIRALRAG